MKSLPYHKYPKKNGKLNFYQDPTTNLTIQCIFEDGSISDMCLTDEDLKYFTKQVTDLPF